MPNVHKAPPSGDYNLTPQEQGNCIQKQLNKLTVKLLWWHKNKDHSPLPLSVIVHNECRELYNLGADDETLKTLGFQFAASIHIGKFAEKVARGAA